MDRGTEILLEAVCGEGLKGSLLDLGCGVGVVAVICTKLFQTETYAVDINPRAVELTQLNSAGNGVQVDAFVSDGFTSVDSTFDTVLTNPPIRAGKAVIYRMLEDAKTHLNPGGALYAVIRRKQGAESALRKLEEVFGNCTVAARDKGYWVLKSVV